ncbi:hypothetical protein F4814DRAFT_459656 [Daldinia grandis]|nr:hypothetical protein F4814DRAFT_459656 [Daldinia grandis]
MGSKSSYPSGLGTIPGELRATIYDNLEDEDLAPLAQTCQQMRAEVLSRMPGGRFIDFGRVHDRKELRSKIQETIEIKNLNLIAEPWYSSGSALKVGVTWKPKNEAYTLWRTSYWTIRDLSSPMAQFIYLYCPKAITVTFQASTKGSLIVALIILRAKGFDICRILKTIKTHWRLTTELSVRFCGGKDPNRPTSNRKSFWEMRPGFIPPKWFVREIQSTGRYIRRSEHGRKFFPFFYECLMLPLIPFGPWSTEPIQFDLEPDKRRTSYAEKTLHYNPFEILVDYLGYKSLFNFADFAYHLSLRGVDYYGNDDTAVFEGVMSRLDTFTEDIGRLLDNVKGQEVDQLRSYLRRITHASLCNPFAGPLEGNPFDERDAVQVKDEMYVWRCYGEDNAMRKNLIGWAMEE